MSVLSKIHGFISRHKNKFIITGIIISGSVLLTRYAKTQLRSWQEREAIEFLERNRKQTHFESINKTCNHTITNLISTLLENVFDSIDTDDIVEKLKTNPGNKLELWNQLKVKVFTKAGYLIYSIVMLVVILKIQMNIVGGYLYKDQNSVPVEVQEKYLKLCQSFLNHGTEKLGNLIESEVSRILANIDLRKEMKLGDIEAIFWSLQSSLATSRESPIEHISRYILDAEIPNGNDVYTNMNKDMLDLLESDELKMILTHCVNRGFVLLGDQIAESFVQNGAKITEVVIEPTNAFDNPFMAKKPMAKLIPLLNSLMIKQSLPQNVVQMLVQYEKLQNICANVYESYL